MKKYFGLILPLGILCNFDTGMCMDRKLTDKTITACDEYLIFRIIQEQPIDIQQFISCIQGNPRSLYFFNKDLTALHYLIINRNHEAIEQIIRIIDNLVSPSHQQTLPQWAAIKIFNARTSQGYSPLHIATEKACTECSNDISPSFLIAMSLINNRFTNISLITLKEQTPLDIALSHLSKCPNPYCKVKTIAAMLQAKNAKTANSIMIPRKPQPPIRITPMENIPYYPEDGNEGDKDSEFEQLFLNFILNASVKPDVEMANQDPRS